MFIAFFHHVNSFEKIHKNFYNFFIPLIENQCKENLEIIYLNIFYNNHLLRTFTTVINGGSHKWAWLKGLGLIFSEKIKEKLRKY